LEGYLAAGDLSDYRILLLTEQNTNSVFCSPSALTAKDIATIDAAGVAGTTFFSSLPSLPGLKAGTANEKTSADPCKERLVLMDELTESTTINPKVKTFLKFFAVGALVAIGGLQLYARYGNGTGDSYMCVLPVLPKVE
jgi:hypothetical protein